MSTFSMTDNDNSPIPTMKPVVTILDHQRRSQSPSPTPPRDPTYKIDKIQQVEQIRRNSKNQSPDYTNSDLQFLKNDLLGRPKQKQASSVRPTGSRSSSRAGENSAALPPFSIPSQKPQTSGAQNRARVYVPVQRSS